MVEGARAGQRLCGAQSLGESLPHGHPHYCFAGGGSVSIWEDTVGGRTNCSAVPVLEQGCVLLCVQGQEVCAPWEALTSVQTTMSKASPSGRRVVLVLWTERVAFSLHLMFLKEDLNPGSLAPEGPATFLTPALLWGAPEQPAPICPCFLCPDRPLLLSPLWLRLSPGVIWPGFWLVKNK